MSHVLYWPGQIFLYPLGNTSAICLTEELPPEHKADVLLLGCGDPRNILYTVYADASLSNEPRKLDITCCDHEAAILARNTLLFTFLADDGAEDRLASIWNVFYHMMLDETSFSLLIEQCRKLVPLAESLDSWRQGPYAHIVSMCNSDTLSDISRFWKLWLGTSNFNAKQAKRFKENFQNGMKSVRKRYKDGIIITSMRSAGPLAPVTLLAVSEHFKRFWTTGTTDDGSPDVKSANNPNPTFAFSLFGDEFAVHYGTDPISGFHLAEALASSGLDLSNQTASVIPKIVQAARQQFNTWCNAVIRRTQNTSASSASLTVRMYAGEALGFCWALLSVNKPSVEHTPIFIAPWRRSVVQLDNKSYSPNVQSPAPTSFNVIETSNLLDHLGLQNLLTVTTPLLSHSPSSTLYTEALLHAGDSPAQGILDHACGDLSTISLLLGVVPSTYISRFTTHSNVSETMMQAMANSSATQYHERLAWKHINFGHPLETFHEAELSFTPHELARKLFDIYLKMFHEDLGKRMAIMSLDKSQMAQKIQFSGIIHYTRRSLTLFLAHIRTRVRCDWNRVINDLEELILNDRILITGCNFYQEMACHLQLAGFRLSWSNPTKVQQLRSEKDPPFFRTWSTVPEVVTVVLVVPRLAIAKVQSDLSDAGTPILQCEVRANIMHNAFACISASFGKLEVSGEGENQVAVVMEDRAGIKGTSPLIVSFPILSACLIAMSEGTVGLVVRSTLGSTTQLTLKLGLEMCLFKASLTDERCVHVLTRAPTTSNDTVHRESVPAPPKLLAITRGHPIHVDMDKSNTQIQSLTAHVDILDPAGQASLASGCAVTVEQLSLNRARIHVDQYQHIIPFPLPVDATNAKLRIARKSKYVEVVAPMTLTLGVKGESNVTGNIRTAFDCGVPTLWNMHRVNLDRCPSFKLSKSRTAFNWLGPHVALMFSQRELTMRTQSTFSGPIPDTFMNLKDSLYSLFISATGLKGPTHAEFALWNPEEEGSYATILVTDIRLDTGSHTVVADSWIIPGSNDIQDKLKRERAGILSIKTDANESEAWRYLLPLLIERCRTWKHKPSCEYLVQNSIPLYPGAGSDANKVPWCSCGMGIGTNVLRKRYGNVSANYATRAAISPLFPVSYIEKVGAKIDNPVGPSLSGCAACEKGGVPLSVCSRCKRVKYCSKDCQVKDWTTHKKNCVLA
ncbi:hypothetical protein BKA82DRAFT_21336 [Pisolithus tinctorius]|uniref:MYND-type domain-containing protein n=1 Tax=Pisolithus tinctorius Marx 270 TaxID=870435 RepID=A0A0C3PPJ9_PISTI|nr:hypothetical protein BKA82DRAFT_21336 [Pisolithus tinctorius]KIO10384.1 hypothetical protein M404DRAFT_21336 [Pisolithus tinctorius Marx 270]